MPAILKISAVMALFSGLLLASMETYINWGQWQWWPWWLVDYVAAGFLIIGALLVFSKNPAASKWLCTGWAFTIGMGWMSLASNWSTGADPDRAARVGGFYVELLMLGALITIVGLILALFAGDKKGTENVL